MTENWKWAAESPPLIAVSTIAALAFLACCIACCYYRCRRRSEHIEHSIFNLRNFGAGREREMQYLELQKRLVEVQAYNPSEKMLEQIKREQYRPPTPLQSV